MHYNLRWGAEKGKHEAELGKGVALDFRFPDKEKFLDTAITDFHAFLPIGALERQPWLRNSISRCFFAPIKRPPLNRDELTDVDYYPDAYLDRLAHEGVNGLWWMIFGCGYTLLRERKISLKSSAMKYALYSGALVCGIVLFLKLAVNRKDASVAVSVSQFSFLVAAPLAACFMYERFTRNM